MTVTVNGSPITSFTVDEKGSSLSFNALVTIEYSDFVCKDDDGGSWKKGSGSELSFTFDHENGGAKKEEFRFLLADDEEIEKDDKNYTVKDGSIIISLQPAYLETLSLGEHKITAVFDGEKFVNVSFSILEKDKEEKKDDSSRKSTNRYVAPRTGVE